MTTNPQSLLAARALLRDHLGIPVISLGIAGDTDHVEGGDSYHLGANQIRARNGRDRYSVDESPRDKAGLTNYASALDIGWFEVRVGGKVHNLRTFSIWLVAQCKAGTADTRDIREVIYSPDGKVVKRWDRLGRRTTGDSSHRSHTHASYFRDAIKAGRGQSAVYRRYLTEIGLLAGEDEIDMTPQQAQQLRDAHYTTAVAIPNPTGDGKVPLHVWAGWMADTVKALAKAQAAGDAALGAKLAEIDQEATDRAAALTAQVAAVPTATVHVLGAVESDAEVAARLRALLGDRAAAVGALLAAG